MSTLYKGCGKKQCLLDFASYTKLGGGFLTGSMAQEEALCHESVLYNILSRIPDFYSGNIESGKNDGFYSNRAAYVKNVVFVRGEKEIVSDVLVCAAPNRNAASSKRHTKRENSAELHSRIEFIVGILREHELNRIILGAFGCGVFKRNPSEVAEIFMEEIGRQMVGYGGEIIFAVPKGGQNYKAFADVVGRTTQL